MSASGSSCVRLESEEAQVVSTLSCATRVRASRTASS